MPSEPHRIRVVVTHPAGALRGDGPWLQFLHPLPVTADAPEHQAHQLVSGMTADDPRVAGALCGGSKQFADALGFPWPPPGRI